MRISVSKGLYENEFYPILFLHFNEKLKTTKTISNSFLSAFNVIYENIGMVGKGNAIAMLQGVYPRFKEVQIHWRRSITRYLFTQYFFNSSNILDIESSSSNANLWCWRAKSKQSQLKNVYVK